MTSWPKILQAIRLGRDENRSKNYLLTRKTVWFLLRWTGPPHTPSNPGGMGDLPSQLPELGFRGDIRVGEVHCKSLRIPRNIGSLHTG